MVTWAFGQLIETSKKSFFVPQEVLFRNHLQMSIPPVGFTWSKSINQLKSKLELVFEICLTRHYVLGDIRNENIAGVFLKVLVFMYHLFSYNRNLFKSSDQCIIFFSLKKTYENYKKCFLFKLYISLKKTLSKNVRNVCVIRKINISFDVLRNDKILR